MKNIKDRTIRIENIPKDLVIYQSKQRFRYTFIVIVLFSISLVMLDVNFYLIIIILLVINVFLSALSKVNLELSESFLLNYIEEEFVEIIYYSEILNYRVTDKESRIKTLKILTNDESEYNYTLSDPKIFKALKKMIGAKKVG